MSTIQRLQAILFDVDGTIAETERDGHRVAFNAAFADFGLDWVWDVERYGALLSVTGGKERIRRYIEEESCPLPHDVDLDSLVRRLHQRKTEHYVSLVEQGAIGLRPGVLRLLRAARGAGVRMAIATTTTPDNVLALLGSVTEEPGLADWFEEIAAGDVVPAKKPAGDIYDLVLSTMGLSPEYCVAIEDSANGLKSAKAAGIDCVVVTPSVYSADEDFSGAALVVDCLGDEQQPARVIRGQPWGGNDVGLEVLDRLITQTVKA
jgi:HAD superfamily hydrolase (TIGR01509 family)